MTRNYWPCVGLSVPDVSLPLCKLKIEYTVKAGLCGQEYYHYDARGRVTKMWNISAEFSKAS